MGNCITVIENVRRPDPEYGSIKFEEAEQLIKPFDVLLFKGGDFISDGIRKIEKATSKVGAFSHAALVISPKYIDFRVALAEYIPAKEGPERTHFLDVIKELEANPDKLYTWEITMSGNLNDGVTDAFGKSFLGVQIRSFDEVMLAVRNNPKVRVAWLQLKPHEEARKLEAIKEIEVPDITIEIDTNFEEKKRKATILFQQTYEAPYEACFCILMAASCPSLRCCSTKGTTRFFCSEFVAYILKEMGFLASSCHEEKVVPVDFIPSVDVDREINCCVEPKYLL